MAKKKNQSKSSEPPIIKHEVFVPPYESLTEYRRPDAMYLDCHAQESEEDEE